MTDYEEINWISRAACRTESTNTFFIARGDPDQARKRQKAFAICEECPVRKSCLEYAMVNRETGIWGGTSDADRRRMKRSRTWNTRFDLEPRRRFILSRHDR